MRELVRGWMHGKAATPSYSQVFAIIWKPRLAMGVLSKGQWMASAGGPLTIFAHSPCGISLHFLVAAAAASLLIVVTGQKTCEKSRRC